MANDNVDIAEKVNVKNKNKNKTKTNDKIQAPKLYHIIYLNDNVTTMEFVVTSLVSLFDYSVDQSIELATKVHNDGSSSVGVFPYEIAEQKGIDVTVFARNNGYPLCVRIQPES